MTAEDKTKPMTDLFEQATKNYEQLLKIGLKMQQDSAKWLTTATAGVGSPDIQKKIKSVADEIIPQAQKNLDEYVKAVEENGRTGIDLLKKAVALTQAASPQDAQLKAMGLWEASVTATFEKTQAVTQSGTKAMGTWLDFARKVSEPLQAAGKS